MVRKGGPGLVFNIKQEAGNCIRDTSVSVSRGRGMQKGVTSGTEVAGVRKELQVSGLYRYHKF